MCLMLQKEVADRLMAEPGRKEYGPLTVVADYWATTEGAGVFPRQAFWPPPEVSSSLVVIRRRPERVMSEGYHAFAGTVARLFAGRRKTLGRNLRDGWGAEKADGILAATGLEAARRAETLGTADFEAIALAGGAPRD
jgi:16S rRNA (adenine1518-N6/adenine1519-N6)-dimethyltransferase